MVGDWGYKASLKQFAVGGSHDIEKNSGLIGTRKAVEVSSSYVACKWMDWESCCNRFFCCRYGILAVMLCRLLWKLIGGRVICGLSIFLVRERCLASKPETVVCISTTVIADESEWGSCHKLHGVKTRIREVEVLVGDRVGGSRIDASPRVKFTGEPFCFWGWDCGTDTI